MKNDTPKRWTDIAIKAFRPRAVRYEEKCPGLPGLRLEIMPSGSRSFIVRFTHGGRYQRLTLGQYPQCSLAKASELYREAMDALMSGRNPAYQAKRQRQGIADPNATLAAFISLYEQEQVPTMRPGTAAYVKADLARLQDALPGAVMKEIKKSDLVKAVGIAKRRGPSAANTFTKVVKMLFGWIEQREDDYTSPAHTITKPFEETSRERVLKDDELRVVWRAAEKVSGPPGALVKLLILTGCRRNEIMELARYEIEADCIRLLPERVKNRREHTIPLTDALRAVLAELPKGGAYVINGNDRPAGDHSGMKAKIDGAMASPLRPWTFHDLRRSVGTGMERLGIRPPVIEACLNHKKKGITQIYQRHDYGPEAKAAFETWSAHVESLVGDQRAAA